MTKTKLDTDASDSIGGIIYQFYIALDKSFELAEAESLFIEKDGDVSNAQEQIEVKNYRDSLSDSHINFWKTLSNWLNPQFDHRKYKSLILLTTQDYGENTKFKNWNVSGGHEKLLVLNDIKKKASERYQAKLKTSKDGKVTKPGVLTYMENVLADDNSEKLLAVIEKFAIDNGTAKPPEYYAKIKTQYLKGIPTVNRDIVMKGLLGIFISPQIVEDSFEITYEYFSSQFQLLSEQFCSVTKIFPKKWIGIKISEEEQKEYLNQQFVQKILEINYDEVVAEAITDFVTTKKTISDELYNRITGKQIYEAYNSEIIKQIEPLYRTACRNFKDENVISESKDHYDRVIKLPSPVLGTFTDTHITFKNGTVHLLANDNTYQLNWKLKR